MAALALAPALGVPQLAQARENGERYRALSSTTSTVTTPSGLVATMSVQSLARSSDAVPDNGGGEPMNLRGGSHDPALTLAGNENSPHLGISGAHGPSYTVPRWWSGDDDWHPAYRITVDFSEPVVDPILAIGGYNIHEDMHTDDGTVLAEETKAQQLRFDTSAPGPQGTQPVTVSARPGFNTSLYNVANNTITPKLVNGHVPYMNTQVLACMPSTPQPEAGGYELIGQSFSQAGALRFISPPCGSLQLDTAGKPITSIGLNVNLSYFMVAVYDDEGVWDQSSYAGTGINVSLQHELSGWRTPASLGAATHVVGDLRLGDDIRSARNGENVSQARAGVEGDNSDGGYMAPSQISRAPLTRTSSGAYTITVPYSGLSKDAYVNAWIDFNNNGTWDEGESATGGPIRIPESGGNQGTVKIPFTIPSGGLPVTEEGLNARIRIAYSSDDVARSAGMAASGEVEDHRFPVAASAPDLNVDKKASVVGTATKAKADKGAANAAATIGSVIRYDVTITNDSNFEATNVTMSDTLPAGMKLRPLYPGTTPGIRADGQTISWGPTTLAGGASTTVTYFAEATASGTQTNLVVVDADGGCADEDKCTDGEDVVVDHAGKLTIVKSTPELEDNAVVVAGQKILYRLTVKNESTANATDVTVTDELIEAAGLTCELDETSLAPNEEATCQVTYTVTKKDVEDGFVLNVATASGQWPDGPIPGDTDEKENPTAAPDLNVDKAAEVVGGGVAAVGSTIKYDVTITNDSDFDATGVVLTDTLPAGMRFLEGDERNTEGIRFADGLLTWGPTTLAGGESATVTYYAEATASGVQENLVVVDSDGGCKDDDKCTDSEETVVDRTGGLSLTKTTPDLPENAVFTVGQEVVYELTVTNESSETISKVTVDDELVEDQGQKCLPGETTLGPGAHTSCRVTYTVTEEDVKEGFVLNQAIANGEWENETPVDPDYAEKRNEVEAPDLKVDKSASVVEGGTDEGAATIGSIIKYDVTITNRSEFPATNVTMSDRMPTGMRFLDGDERNTEGVRVDGDRIVWGPQTLAAGASQTVTFYAEATQAGTQENLVVVDADGGCKDEDNCTDSEETDVDRSGKLTLVKSTPDLAEGAVVVAGQKIRYLLTVTNDSDATVVDVAVDDPLVQDAGLECRLGADTLAPGDDTSCEVTYTVTDEDVANGTVLNQATATGNWADEVPVPSGYDETENPARAPDLDVDKTASVVEGDKDGAATVGSIIRYDVTITNDSAFDVTGVRVRDTLPGGVEFVENHPGTSEKISYDPVGRTLSWGPSDLEAGDSVTLTYFGRATAQGTQRNVVVVDADGGCADDDKCTDDSSTDVDRTGELTVVKTTPDLEADAVVSAGQTIRYVLTVTNNSSEPASGVAISDPMVEAAGGSCLLPITELAPTASTSCEVFYTVTKEDVANGTVLNQATASGEWPDGEDIPGGSDETENPAKAPDLEVDKSASVVGGGEAVIGSTIEYRVTVTNRGTFDAYGVTATDDLPIGMTFLPDHEGTSTGITVTGKNLSWGQDVLAAGDSMTMVYYAEATSRGAQRNVVVADSEGGCQDDESCTDDETEDVEHAGGLTIEKSTPELEDEDAVVTGGQTILYRLVVTNNSTETIDEIKVEDPLVEKTGQQCVLQATTLKPEESTHCDVTYTVTKEDVRDGTVLNHAVVSGVWPDGTEVPEDSDDKRNPAEAPDLKIDKSDSVVTGGDAVVGSVLRYEVKVTNRGTFDAYGVTTTDTLPSGVQFIRDHHDTTPGIVFDSVTRKLTWETDVIKAGETVTLTYFVRATDAGTQRNTVVADSDGGCKDDESCTDDETEDVEHSGELRLVKSTPGLTDGAVLTAGQEVTYRLTVFNDSTERVEEIEVDDPIVNAQGQQCSLNGSALDPGKSASCDVVYKVTKADVRAGKVLNHATAKGEWPDGTDVPEGSDDKENPAQAPDILVDKTAKVVGNATADGKATVGSIIEFTVTVTNRSAFTANGVRATDTLPSGVVFRDGHEGTSAGVTHSGGIVSWGPATVGSQETVTWTYYGTATDSGTQRNSVVIDTDGGCKDDESCTDDSTTDVDHAGELTLVKSTPGLADDAVLTLGQHVTYRLTVTNKSSEPVTKVNVEDQLVEAQGGKCTLDKTTLQPGEDTSCEVVYVVTQADVDAGKVINHATAKGTWPDEKPIPDGKDDKENPAGTGEGGLVINKTATVAGGKATAKAGDTINFAVTATNTSDRTLSNVTIRDEMLAGAGVQLICSPGNPVATLAPGARVECAAKYTVSAADAKNGLVHNVATGTGDLPGGGPAHVVPGESTTKATVPPADKKQLPWTGAAGTGGLALAALALATGGGMLILRSRRTSER